MLGGAACSPASDSCAFGGSTRREYLDIERDYSISNCDAKDARCCLRAAKACSLSVTSGLVLWLFGIAVVCGASVACAQEVSSAQDGRCVVLRAR